MTLALLRMETEVGQSKGWEVRNCTRKDGREIGEGDWGDGFGTRKPGVVRLGPHKQ